jgi:wobble nucleotide-excising tRNase
MIENVVDLTRKSFKSYTGPGEKFKLKNAIFGYNGRGKSSLAIGVRDAYFSDGSASKDKIRFFNKDYVDDNLSLQDPATGTRSKNKLKGVIAHFSAKDVKSEEDIKELQNKLIDTKPIEAKVEELKTDTRKAVDAIHDRRKGTAAIQKKNKDFDIEEVVRLYTQDLDEAKKIEADEAKLSKMEGDNVIGEKVELLRTIAFQDFTKITDQEITDAQDIFGKTYGNISIPSSEIVDWLNTGIKLHEDGDDCKFCGGKITLRDITKRVEEYNANEKQKDTKSLQSLDSKIAELQNTIKTNLDKKTNTKSALDSDIKIDNSFTYIEEASIGITNARNAIQSKIKNIDKKMTFVEFKGELQKFNDAIKVLTDIRDAQIDKLEIQNSNKNELVKGAIGFEILNDENIKGKLSDIATKKDELKNAITGNGKLNVEIQNLKQAENATSDFAVYINDILTNLNIHLMLLVSEDGNNYLIQHTQTSASLTIADISEGERNLLALLFFYYELFNDNEQQDFKSDIELIIVDDPISSMDDINKMYILELMKQILALDTPQVFMMTHSWDDFANICYGLFDKPATPTVPATPYGFYEIKKDASGNSLVLKTKSNVPPYHHNFLEVYDFSQKPDTTSLDDCDIYHTPNIMRQVLEGFLGFKTHKNSPTKNNEKEIGRVLFDKEWTALTESEKTELGQLLLVTNVNSHSSSPNPDEIWKSAKFLMNRIKAIDKRHFNTNKEPISL